MKKNIAIFIDNLQVGGIQRSVVNLLNNIDHSKYNIDLYVFNDNIFFDVPKNVNIIFLKKPSFIYKFIPFNIAYRFMRIKTEGKKYFLAIDYETYQTCSAVGALKCNAKKRVMWIHNDLVMKSKYDFKFRVLYFFGKRKYRRFDTFCAVSDGALQSFKKLQKLDDKEYLVIPNFIDTKEIFNKLKDGCDINIDNKIINIVSMGRLCKQKGFDLLLNDIKELLNYRTDFHLYIIGDGALRKKLEKMTSNLELSDYVTFLGSQKNPFKYMKNMDLFFLKSRYEGQGMVLLEAKSIGLDVLIPDYLEKYCPNVGGCEDVVNYLKEYKKRKTKNVLDPLNEYNNDIKDKINKLFNGV